MPGLASALFLATGLALAQDPVDDKKIRLPTEWKRCQQDSDCERIHYGCDGVSAVHHRHREKAQAQAYRLGGDSRAMNCEQRQPSPLIDLECRANTCLAIRQPASPNCPFVLRSSGIDGGELRESSRGFFVATDEAQCRKKCEDERVRRRRSYASFPQFKWELDCSWRH